MRNRAESHRDKASMLSTARCWAKHVYDNGRGGRAPNDGGAIGTRPTRRLGLASSPKGEPNQALACYGARCQQTQERYFYSADGQPNSDKTIAMLQALFTVAQQKAKEVLIVLWDRASWHKTQKVKHWVHAHNRRAKQQDNSVRLLTHLLPAKSPWLNPMDPIWLHRKRKIVEPDSELSVKVLQERLCAHFQTTLGEASLNLSA